MREFLSVLWRRKARLLVIWGVVMFVALVRVLAMPDVYTSGALMTPLALEQVEEMPQSALGGGAVRSLLGRGANRDEFAVAAFMQSRELLDRVIKDLDLKRELFPKRWDDDENEWLDSRGGEPTDGEARRSLDKKVDVAYDEFTGLLELEVNWESPELAHRVAAAFVDVADRTLRDAAIAEGERRVDELLRELDAVTVGEIEVFLSEEMTHAVSALASIRARANYAFRVIDPPVVPDRKSWPPRLFLLVLVGVVTAAAEVGVVAGIRLRRDAGGPSGG